MHLKYESPLTWMYVGIPIVLLGLMLGGIFIDNPLRRSAQDMGHNAGAVPHHIESSEAHH